MSKLYELTGQYLALANLADDPNMPPEALADSLEGLQGEIEIKAQALMQVVAGMDGDVTAIDAEIKRLQHRKAVITNRTERLKDYLRHNMKETGITNISCPLFQITLGKPKPLAVIEDERAIPDEYVSVSTSRSPDKAKILKALKSGASIPGCALGESRPALIIK